MRQWCRHVTERHRPGPDPDGADRTRVERIDPLVGAVFDKRYRVDFRLAAGGFGAIYRGTHLKSGHQVALKVLHREMATDPRVVARFRREGEALTTLRDPHTITAYEIGEASDGALYIVMELLHGESLYERFRARGPLGWKAVAKIAHEICSSLAEAHARGIVHRDLKPANIHLEPRGDDPDYVKVLDFGIAKILNGGGGDTSDLTNAGQMIGTFDYMSPEQMVGGCTTRSDIYTLGVLMYEMICGKRPFDDVVGPTGLLAALITRQPPRLGSRASVPPELDRIVMRCLEKEPEARYPDVHELQRDLHRLIAPTLQPDDEATRAIQLPLRESAAKMQVGGDDATWLATVPAPAPVSLTPTPGPTPTPGLTPTPGSLPTPTPVFQPQPNRPPVVFPPAVSIAPPNTPSNQYPAPQPGAYPQPIVDHRSAPVPYPAAAHPAAPPRHHPPTAPPWPARAELTPPRPAQVEIRSYDMAGATSRDAWVGRLVWVILIVIGVVIALFVTHRL